MTVPSLRAPRKAIVSPQLDRKKEVFATLELSTLVDSAPHNLFNPLQRHCLLQQHHITMDTLLSELLRLQQQNEQQAQEQAQAQELVLKLVVLLLQQSQTTPPIPAPKPESAVPATIGLSTPPNTIPTTTPANTIISHNATPTTTTTTTVQQKKSPKYHDFSNEMPPPAFRSPTDLDRMCFAEKLHYLLSQKETESKIGWRPHGRAFKIHVPDLFAMHVCPKYFGHCSFARFRNDLVDHGFKRIPNGRDEGSKLISFAELARANCRVGASTKAQCSHVSFILSSLFHQTKRLLP